MLRTCNAMAMGICALGALAGPAQAVEQTFGLYALGSAAVGAGQTPPAGVYLTTAVSYSQFHASKDIPFGGLNITLDAYLPVVVGNLTAVIPQEILGGHLSLSATSGFANIREIVGASAGATINKTVQGWGATDTNIRMAIGWEVSPVFSHKLSITEYFPTGQYATGLAPIIGLNRNGADFSWGATLIEPTTKLEFSGTAGFTLEGYNPATSYRSGNTVHFEEGISKHFDGGFRVSAISYQYLQVAPDTGSGAKLGAFRTRAVAVGPSVGYTTLIADHLVSFNLQATREVAFRNRLRQTNVQFSTTVKF